MSVKSEKYKSKSAMMKHEKSEGSKERKMEYGKSAKHPGFKVVQKKIAKKSGVGMKAAGAILASASRGASAAAKKKNPRLKRVK